MNVLFDLDDTLLDFQAAQEYALSKLFTQHDIPLTAEIKQRYKEINRNLWSAYEEGEVAKSFVLTARFEHLFEELGLHFRGEELEPLYRKFLQEKTIFISGAERVVDTLKQSCRLSIATNGVAATQQARLKLSGLMEKMDDIFISETIGAQKPSAGFFSYVLERLPEQETVIIGDSLTADIAGGNKAGLKTIWFNPEGKQRDTGITPDMEVRKLTEIPSLLERKEKV
ncbi:YjjG family noncanonical pyrimidine nucleotidase [Alkalicoccus urumqiensis]|nr:YjjG family noncanonical pyrimidine nucleotidase [Alkalicoccus urumqiensis]